MCAAGGHGHYETFWVDQGIIVGGGDVLNCIAICLDYVFVYCGKNWSN